MEYPDGFQASYSNRGVCGIVAVAVCANVSWEVAKQTLKRAMHKLSPNRQRFRGATNVAQRDLALKWLAVKTTNLPAAGLTVESFVKNVAEPGKLYMLRYKGHVFTVKDGVGFDQSGPIEIAKWCSRKKPLLNITRIDGKGW